MKKEWVIFAYILLAVVTFAPRVFLLDAFTSPDEPQWERNTQNFVKGLTQGDLKSLYQQPHPGITTQWLAAASIAAPTWGEKRLPLALFLSISVLYITYIVRRGWGDTAALITGFLLALNPLLIAHSRVLAMDALLGMFSIATIIHHILWIEHKKKYDIALVGVFSALAMLSKLSAFGLVIYVIIGTIIVVLAKKVSWNKALRGIGTGIGAGLLTAVIVFPTLLTNFSYVWEGSVTFFTTEHFQQHVHALGPWWYPEAFLIWTTPLQLIGLLSIAFILTKKNPYRWPIIMLSLFCIIFFLEIQYSIKKGDRYMLPVFLAFDVISALVLVSLFKKYIKVVIALCVIGISWQAYEIVRLHPHELAYRNPLFVSIAKGRTMGWGEGLDVAAAYLNEKPNAEDLLVAAYYESSFAYHFKGKFTSAERLGKESAQEIGADYVVLYRTMEGRAQERWETKVLAEYKNKIPEKIISLNNEEYVWIYKIDKIDK